MCKSTAGDSVVEYFERETRESTGDAEGGRTSMRILASKGRLDFTNLWEKKHFPRFPIHTWSYETRIYFSKIKRRHILERENFEVFIDGNKSPKLVFAGLFQHVGKC